MALSSDILVKFAAGLPALPSDKKRSAAGFRHFCFIPFITIG
jgi:hypothetical protein